MNQVIQIGKHVSPAPPAKVIDERMIKSIKMSCGGGIGGAQWQEYGYIKNGTPNFTDWVEFEDYFTGETKMLNPNFIVKIEDRKVVAVKSDCRQNSNFKCNFSIAYYLMREDAKYVLVDKCGVKVDKSDAEEIKWDYID